MRILALIVLSVLVAASSFGQDMATNVAGGLDVRATIVKEKQRREQEKREIEDKLRDLNDRLAEVKAKEKELLKQVPELQNQLRDARQEEQQAYVALTAVSDEFNAAEASDLSAFRKQIIDALQMAYDNAYAKQKSEHERDMAFIERNKWTREDFEELVLPMDPEDTRRTLVFKGERSNRASGVFPTVEFSTGERTWHSVPRGATFSVKIHTVENPFIADVSIHPGSDMFEHGSTNLVDWDIHVFIAKHYESRKGGRYELTGVSWPVDINRSQCWQAAVTPVFMPTPMPIVTNATDQTPEIALQLGEWRFKNEGQIQRLEDAKRDLKAAKHRAVIYQRLIPKTQKRVDRKMSELTEDKRELEDKIEEFENILREYIEDEESEGGEGGEAGGGGVDDFGGGAAGGDEQLNLDDF